MMGLRPNVDRLLVPVTLLKQLAEAGELAYIAAYGGSYVELNKVHNAARAARNIIARHESAKGEQEL